MAANPFYYLRRHSNQILAENPTMTRERYMEGYDYTNSLVNTMIGIANEVARLAISDGIDAIKKAGLYKQKTKQLCNETFRHQEAYEAIHNRNFGDRLELWLDYLDGTEDEYRKHIFNVYIAVKQVLDKHKQKNTELKAKLECGRICGELAVDQFDALMQNMKKKFGVDYTTLFVIARYSNPLYSWIQVCDLYVKNDDPADYIDLNSDTNLRLAVDVLHRKMGDTELINRIGKRAIEMNMEIAKQYVSKEDLQELGLVD